MANVTPNAVITYADGTTVTVMIAADGSSIVDTNGNHVSLPSGVTLANVSGSDTMNIVKGDGTILGTIAPYTAPTGHTDNGTTSVASGLNPATTPITIAGGSTTESTSDDTDTSTTDTSTTPSTGPTGTGTTRIFAGTRTLADGGARAKGHDGTDTPVEGAIDPNGDYGGGGDDTSGGGDGGDGSNPDNPGPWGENNPQHDPAPNGTYDPADSGIDGLRKVGNIGGPIAGGLGVIAKWAKLGGTFGKLAGAAGVGFGALGVFSSFYNMFKTKDWGSLSNWLGVASSVAGVYMGLIMLGLSAGPAGWVALAIVGAAIALAWAVNKLQRKKDKKADAEKGDVVGLTNVLYAPPPPGWAQGYLPVKSVYMILASVTALGLGFDLPKLDLSNSGPMIRQEIIAPSLIPSFNTKFTNTLQKATNTTITGGLLGKIFIKAGDDSVADKVVYMTEFTNEDPSNTKCKVGETCQAVNMVTLNQGGNLASPFKPSDRDMRQPFFFASNGTTRANPDAFNDLGQMGALVQVPESNATPTGKVVGINMAAMMGHRATPAQSTNNQ